MWGSFVSTTVGRSVTFYNDIKAWAFPTSNEVNIFCNLHICVGKCANNSCIGRRLRRQHSSSSKLIDDNDQSGTTIAPARIRIALRNSDVITLLSDETIIRDNNDSGAFDDDDGEWCLSQFYLGAVVAALLAVALIAIAIGIQCAPSSTTTHLFGTNSTSGSSSGSESSSIVSYMRCFFKK